MIPSWESKSKGRYVERIALAAIDATKTGPVRYNVTMFGRKRKTIKN
jgi:hypothetical protein